MLEYENYRQELRKAYHPKYVERRFYEALEKIGIPEDGDRFAFITVKPKGPAGWDTSNNAMNAFEFKFNRKLWIRRSRKEKMPNAGSIESDTLFHKYHFHYLVKLKEVKVLLTDNEIKHIIEQLLKELREVNKKDPKSIQVMIFRFDKTKANSRSDAFGTSIHYLVKSSQKHYNPLERKVYSQKEQEKHNEENTTTHSDFSKERPKVQGRINQNERGRRS